MDLLQLTYFCHAAQTENFSKTAEAFYVPPTSVSQTVKRLEKELGARLFDREANKLALNETGALFYEKVRLALSAIEEGKRSVQNANASDAGTIKILAYTCRRIVTQTVETFKTVFPRVTFIIHHGKGNANGDYDFIVGDREFPSRLSQKCLLLSEKIVLACHKTHPLANKKITAKALSDEEFISMSAGNSLHAVLTDIAKREGFAPKIAIQSDDPFYVRKYLDEGLGVALVPEISWRGAFSENILLKALDGYTRDTYVFSDQPAFMPHLQKQFLTYLKKAFAKETLPTA